MKLTRQQCLGGIVVFFLLFELTTISNAQSTSPIDHIEEKGMVYSKFKRQKDDPEARARFEHMLIENPETHLIPENIEELEHAFAESVKWKNKNSRFRLIPHSPWRQRGPFNVGGRTRALAMDKYNENVLFAGGVAGGLWRSIDAGKSWVKVTTPTDRQSITCIIQDPRPSYANIWYYGAGEVYGNSASGGGASYRGNGIFKSTDGGISWNPIASTESDPTITEGNFQYVSRIDITGNGTLLVAHSNGVSRSTDNGKNWEVVLDYESVRFTEVLVRGEGTVFATIAGYGIFKSTDHGQTWNDITPTSLLSGNFQRIVMDYARSNPNVVMFFAHTPGGGINNHKLLKLLDNTGSWQDLSQNLPAFGGYVGNLSQGSYNQYVKIKPNNENVVFIGSTNLYRSDNGFTSPNNTYWIGGYSTKNNVSIYENHHPDNHELIFFSSNPDRVITAHDGGVSITSNVMNEKVEWEYLNNGYYTTQAYAIAIDEKTAGDNRLMAGFQDNGKWYSNTTDIKANWIEEYAGGDGCYVAIVPGEDTRYTSTQYGKILRFKGEDPQNPTDFDGIHPRDARGQLFVNPYILDHNDHNVMYYPAGNKLWLNRTLGDINSGYTFNGTRSGWEQYSNVATSGTITALDVSTSSANKLYIGTTNGSIYKVDNSLSETSQVSNISVDKGLSKGYVSCIAVDPKDEDHVLAVFSNYQVRSVFETKNAGQTWVHVTGNLEENEDGSGAGPSVRWIAFHQPENGESGIFLGTSVGLFYTSALSENTVWKQEGEQELGDAVISMIKTREDGLVAIGTHSNGIYTAYYGISDVPPSVKNQISKREYTVGDIKESFLLSDLFEDPNADKITYQVSSSNDQVATAQINGEYLEIIPSKNNVGEAEITLTASANSLSTVMYIDITVSSITATLVRQSLDQGSTYRSQFFTDFEAPIYSADDFIVPENTEWEVTGVKAYGHSSNDNETIVRVFIWEDDNGKPSSNAIYSSDDVTITQKTGSDILHMLDTPIVLPSGKYWITVAAVMSYAKDGSWYWKGYNGASTKGSPFHIIDPADLYRRDYIQWTSSAEISYANTDLAFDIFGTSENGEKPLAISNLNAVARDNDVVDLSWEHISEVSGYNVYRSFSPDNGFEKVSTVDPTSNTWEDLSQKNEGATYYYQVKAFNASGVSNTSPIVSARINRIPNQVTELKSSFSLNRIEVEWKDESNDEDGFIIEYSLHPNKGFVPLERANRNATSYVIDNLPYGAMQYYIRVAAFNGAGVSSYNYTSSYSLLETPGNIYYEEISPSSLFISWKDNSALETGFLIEYSIDEGKTFPFSFTTNVNTENITLTDLLPNITYYFRLSAINGTNNGGLKSLSQLFVYTMGGSSGPLAPKNLIASKSADSVCLLWDDVIINELGFTVLRKGVNEVEFEEIAGLPYNTTQFTDRQIEEGQIYDYKVRSFNEIGEETSDTITVELPIFAPTDFTVMRKNNANYLKWKDNSQREEEYRVYRKHRDGSFMKLKSLPASEASFVDYATQENSEYTYKVVALFNGAEISSNTFTISTSDNVPQGLHSFNAVENTDGKITLSWIDGQKDGDTYKIFRKIQGSSDSTFIVQLEASQVTAIDNTAAPNMTYIYYIIEFNGAMPSTAVSTSIMTNIDATLPSMPVNFTVTEDENGVMLTWKDMAENEMGYNLYRANLSGGTAMKIANLNPNAESYLDISADRDDEYRYLLTAYNSRGYAPQVETIFSMRTDEDLVLTPPSDFKAIDASTYVRLVWADDVNNEHGFKLYRKQEDGQDTLWIGSVTENVRSFHDEEELLIGDYTYYIASYNAKGESALSEYNFTKEAILANDESMVIGSSKIYPNPSSGYFNLILKDSWSQGASIDVFANDGRKVFQQDISTMFAELDLSHLYQGTYILLIHDGENQEHIKIVKE
ncbi:fibronectin type III domain-containing protein [Flammeovirga sp. SubArs3]|uniref:fibronectin type III domain-containing protein n=1 Tax=Flammeovirga sp. SubArs3 TaxID=2995316 RepID=UPI00248B6A5A|nr:fibronectin type III domain-containing protein [Flammeovirga sp. SubArs3]